MTEPLRALVLGSGYAGKGHTEALRSVGVEVVGMAARTPDMVNRVAAELAIPHAYSDWRQALAELQLDKEWTVCRKNEQGQRCNLLRRDGLLY